MKNLVIVYLLSLVVFIVPVYAGGGHDHNHEEAIEAAPHGGILRDSPPFKVELVLNGDSATIHIYDGNLKVIGKDRLNSKAVAALAFPRDRTKREVVFLLKGDVYEATIPSISTTHRYDLHVKILIDGKEIIGDFGVDNIH